MLAHQPGVDTSKAVLMELPNSMAYPGDDIVKYMEKLTSTSMTCLNNHNIYTYVIHMYAYIKKNKASLEYL